MDELGDKINAVLNDPKQLEKLTGLAMRIMGGEPQGGGAPQPATGGGAEADFALPGRLAAALQKSGARSEKRALLEAMKPYLSEKRRGKLEKALRLAGLATLAELAMEEFGEKSDV